MNTFAYAGANPVMFTDPEGLLLSIYYDKTSGEATIVDLDSGKKIVAKAFSGSADDGYDPAPNGTYTLSHYPRLKSGYYALVHHDVRIDDYVDGTPSNYYPTKVMSAIRFHCGSDSHGCVTLPYECDSEEWLSVEEMISNTKKGIPIEINGIKYPNYGTVYIGGSGYGSSP